MENQHTKSDILLDRVVRATTALAFLRSSVNDHFIADKISEKIKLVLTCTIHFFLLPSSGDSVAQYRIRFLGVLDSIVEFVEYLYVQKKSKNDTTPLLVLRSILKLQLALLDFPKKPEEPAISQGSISNLKISNSQELSVQQQQNNFSKRNHRPTDIKLMANREKIFEYIHGHQKVRTKDVVDAFSSISDRTVKRILKELIRIGYVRKQSSGNAVFYSASN